MSAKACVMCGAPEVHAPRGDERYCKGCWERKASARRDAINRFRFRRAFRTNDAEEYVIERVVEPQVCGRVFAFRQPDGQFNLTALLSRDFEWDAPTYVLEGDPEEVSFRDLVVEAIPYEIVEGWGGGTWVLDVYAGQLLWTWKGEV